MNQLNLKSTIRPKRKRYIKTTPEITAHNILNRKFEEQIPNKKWLTDVTEFKLSNGKKLYLSAIYDLGSKQIISHKLSTSNNNKFVLDTLKKAVKLVPNTEGILLHSDRGYQYTSRLFKVTLEQLGIKQSMSRPGCCIDNGPMEGVWGTIKSELFRGRKKVIFKDKATAIKAINSYIEFFNQRY